jgi:hypothetical protein
MHMQANLSNNKFILKPLTVFICILSPLLWLGCGKDFYDDPPPKPHVPQDCVISIIRTEYGAGSTDRPSLLEFVYESNRLTKTIVRRAIDSIILGQSDYEYNASGQFIKHIPPTNQYDSFVWNNQQLTQIFVLSSEDGSIFNMYELEYSGNQLSNIKERFFETGEIFKVYRIQWIGDNITRVALTDSSGSEYEFVEFSDYDNGKNPYKSFPQGLFGNFGFNFEIFPYLSKNNYRKMTYSSLGIITIRDIELDKNNYPSKIAALTKDDENNVLSLINQFFGYRCN